MDEDELTQDILDQFDLICTQHSVSVSKKTFSVVENNVKVSPYFQGVVPTPLSGSKIPPPVRLTRANSLDTQSPKQGLSVLNCNGMPPSVRQGLHADEDEKQKSEVKNLTNQLATLREELYMKSGELANLKEFADRTNATKSDTIHRLENSLSHERETFRRQLSEVNTQLAFREADYRMVCTELTRLKGQLSTKESVTAATAGMDTSIEFSPASQLIAAVSFSPSSGTSTAVVSSRQTVLRPVFPSPPRALLQTNVDNHLPSPVTPVPSRRVHSTSAGIWKVQTHSLTTRTNEDNSVAAARKHTTTASPARTIAPFSVIHDDSLDECVGTPRKRRRQATPIKMFSINGSSPPPSKPSVPNDTMPCGTGVSSMSSCDVGVNTSQFYEQPMESLSTSSIGRGGLPYRLRPLPVDQMTVPGMKTSYPSVHRYYPMQPDVLANNLLSLNVFDGTDGLNHDFPCEEEQESYPTMRDSAGGVAFRTVDDYVLGLQRLLIRDNTQDSSSATHVSQLSEALPLVLRHIDQRLEAALNVLSTHPFCTVDATSCRCTNETRQRGMVNNTVEMSRSSSSIVPCTVFNMPHGAAYFGEDPFAGAPASQFIAPLMIQSRTTKPPCQTNRRAVASSCPNFSSDESSTQPREPLRHAAIRDKPCCHAASTYILRSGLVSLRHLRSISSTLQSWFMHLSSVGACIPSAEVAQTRDSTARGTRPENTGLLDVIVSLGATISRLVSGLLRRLAGISLTRGMPSCITYRPSRKSADTPLPSLVTTTQSTNPTSLKPSYRSSGITCLSLEGLAVLNTYSLEVLELTTLLASWMPCEQQRLTWDFDMVDCFALCTNAWNSSSDCQTSTGADMDELMSASRATYRATHLPLVGAVFRLFRYLAASAAWTIGHRQSAHEGAENRDPKLATAGPRVTPSWIRSSLLADEQELRTNFLHVLLNGRILRHDCQLLALLKWTQCLITWVCPPCDFREGAPSPTPTDWTSAEETSCSEVHRAELLNQFSGFISTLLACPDIHWSSGCPCKPQVYAVLIELAVKPLQHLLTLAPPTPMTVEVDLGVPWSRLEMQHFISSLSQWIRALVGLSWRHGESCFQSYTDCLPGYFYLVANLARWMQQAVVVPKGCDHSSVPRPAGIGSNLVEELYDFEAATMPGEEAGEARLSQ